MKFSRTTLSLVLLAALGATSAHAQTALTRDQVKAQLAEAVRTGNVLANGDTGLKLNEMYPQRYPQAAVAAGATREQVKAELAEAIRTGNVIAAGDSGMRLNEEFPQRYPAVVVAAGKTREEVKAETAEAIRTGDMFVAGESGLKVNEIYPQRYAKERATYTAQMRAPLPAMAASAVR